MDALLSALLKVSRLGRQQLKPEDLEMGPLLRRMVDTMRFQVEQAGAEVRIGALPACRADAVSVSQLFSNLIDNAVKYRDPRRPLVVEVSGEAAAGKAVYRVADNGPGIPEAELEKLWSVFYKPARSGRKNGEGIGLPLCKRIAERNGGVISVEPAPGGGAVFILELPAAGKREEA
jgi:signal transduction histidine kinase